MLARQVQPFAAWSIVVRSTVVLRRCDCRNHSHQRMIIPATAATTAVPVIIDLRSDTVTQPTRAMRECVLTAPLGDDVMDEDPSVHALQEYTASLLGKEAGLFVPSGTMANLIGILTHCYTHPTARTSGPTEALMGTLSHTSLWEAGNLASVGGMHARTLDEDVETAQFHPQHIRNAFRDDSDDHCSATAVLCLENTHNMLGGVALSSQYINQTIRPVTRELDLRLHIDGARLFHAAIFAQQEQQQQTLLPIVDHSDENKSDLDAIVQDLCRSADSVSVCLSKGLGAPVGSVLVGSREYIRVAKRVRKRVGGGMRQAGILACMGLFALQHNIERLRVDHERAQRFAQALLELDCVLPRHGRVDTNIVYFALPNNNNNNTAADADADDASASSSSVHDNRHNLFADRLSQKHGVRIGTGYRLSETTTSLSKITTTKIASNEEDRQCAFFFRAVVHMDITDADVDWAIDAIRTELRRL